MRQKADHKVWRVWQGVSSQGANQTCELRRDLVGPQKLMNAVEKGWITTQLYRDHKKAWNKDPY